MGWRKKSYQNEQIKSNSLIYALLFCIFLRRMGTEQSDVTWGNSRRGWQGAQSQGRKNTRGRGAGQHTNPAGSSSQITSHRFELTQCVPVTGKSHSPWVVTSRASCWNCRPVQLGEVRLWSTDPHFFLSLPDLTVTSEMLRLCSGFGGSFVCLSQVRSWC